MGWAPLWEAGGAASVSGNGAGELLQVEDSK